MSVRNRRAQANRLTSGSFLLGAMHTRPCLYIYLSLSLSASPEVAGLPPKTVYLDPKRVDCLGKKERRPKTTRRRMKIKTLCGAVLLTTPKFTVVHCVSLTWAPKGTRVLLDILFQQQYILKEKEGDHSIKALSMTKQSRHRFVVRHRVLN